MAWRAPDYESGNLRAAASEAHWGEAARIALDRLGRAAGEPRFFPTGSDVVMDCGELVFKMTAPRWADEIAAEAACLRRVSGRLSVATPEALATGELDGWPYVVMTKIGGHALADAWPSLDSDGRRRLARELGELVAQLHSLEVETDEQAAWPEFFESMREGATKRLAVEGVGTEWVERVEPYLESLEPLSPRAPLLLHTEVLDQHVFVSERDGRVELCGLLDFADGRVGHPYYEVPALVEFIFKGERPLLADFLRGYGLAEAALDEGLSRELLGWGLLHQFGRIPRMLKAAGPPEPESFGELARRLCGFD